MSQLKPYWLSTRNISIILCAALTLSRAYASGTNESKSEAQHDKYVAYTSLKMEPTQKMHHGMELSFPTIAAYLENRANKSATSYSCSIAPRQTDSHVCSSEPTSQDIDTDRIFGVFYSKSDNSGYLFIAKKFNKSLSVMESNPFHIDYTDAEYGWSVERIVAESKDRFYIQTTSGSASMPNSDVFRFKLANGKWVLSGHDHSTLQRCPDDSIDNGDRYSINFLTKKIIIDKYRDCRHEKTIERRLVSHVISWSSFDPSAPDLDPSTYGITW